MVYILRCGNGRYYVGSTDDIERRFSQHQRGSVKSTAHVLPVQLVFAQRFESLQRARAVEYDLKKKKSRKIIEEQIIVQGEITFARIAQW